MSDSNPSAVMCRIWDISRQWSEELHEQKTVDGVFALKGLQQAAFVRRALCISGFPDATDWPCRVCLKEQFPCLQYSTVTFKHYSKLVF